MRITYDLLIATDDIVKARQRLAGRIYKTDISHSNYFSEHCKGEIFFKFENAQRTDSFKIHGASNKLSSLTGAEKCKGVVAYSAGSHTQGVSPSYAMLDIDGKVMMPEGTPKSKVTTTCDYSIEVVLCDNSFNDTIAKVDKVVETKDRIFIPPYDDPKVITDQEVTGLEIMEDLYDINNVIVPIGGGGLVAGVMVAVKSINPAIRVTSVQSENIRDMAAPFHSGEVATHRTTGTLADDCDISRPDNLAYEIIRGLADDTVLVSEDEVRSSMITLVQHNKVVTEGASALACATLLNGKLGRYIQNRKTVDIISGGNINLPRTSQITGFVGA